MLVERYEIRALCDRGELLTGNGHTGLMPIITQLIWQLYGINCVLICPFNPDSVSGLCDYIKGCVYVDKIHRYTESRVKTISLDQVLSVPIPHTTSPSP